MYRLKILIPCTFALTLVLLLPGGVRPETSRGSTAHPFFVTGSGIFVDSGQDLGDRDSEDVALGDLDGDGDLDAFVTNELLPGEVWLNQGAQQGGMPGVFLSSGQSLGSGDGAAVVLGDLDGDDDLDAFVVLDDYIGSNQIWINQGGAQGGTEGVFLGNGQEIGDDNNNGVALGDLDGDGDLDAFVTRVLRPDTVWWNDGSGQFSDSGQSLGGDNGNDVALADLDEDGDLDAYVANWGADTVWLNDGAGIFSDSGQSLQGGTSSRAVALGDVNGDNRIDAFVAHAGFDKLWINQGGGLFADSGQWLDAGLSSDVALDDLDGDGDADAYVTNYGANTVWINQGGDQGGTEGTYGDSGQSLGESWSQGVALGDLDGDGDLDAFVANKRNPTSFSASNKVWLNKDRSEMSIVGCFADSLQRLGESASWEVALGDMDLDGDLDAFVANDGPNEVWLNDGQGVFVSNSQGLGSDLSSGAALGDVDGDGDLDVFVANLGAANLVWLNDGSGILFDSGQALSDASSLDVALTDLDGDNDLDAFVANGRIQNGQPIGVPNTVWINDGRGHFSDAGQSLGNDYSRNVALGDVDGDGDADAFVANYGINKVWLNDGAGSFRDSGQNMSAFFSNDVALGDRNDDGDLDAFVTQGNVPDEVWLNDGLGGFHDSGQRLDDRLGNSVALGDLDGDGDLDAFVTNGAEQSGQPNTVWLNGEFGLKTGDYIDSQQRLGNSISTAVALGDLDGDGDLDAFVGTWASQGKAPNEVWFNGQCCVLEWLAWGPPESPSHAGTKIETPLTLAVIDLQLFFRVRDELLELTPGGQRYIDLYYDNNLEILGLLLTNPALRDAAINTLQLLQPNLQALLDGQGDAVTITAAQVQAVDDFLNNLASAASPTLQQTITDERAELPLLQDFIGLTMAEAHGVVVGYGVYLPIVWQQK